jgi:hypothetical protein
LVELVEEGAPGEDAGIESVLTALGGGGAEGVVWSGWAADCDAASGLCGDGLWVSAFVCEASGDLA